MATKYISSITLPNGDEARLVDKYSGYTTNTGTVTSVTASGALSSSGGTTPAITHNAPSTSPAKSTQAVYPITIDSYGHITAAGTAVTIPAQKVFYGTYSSTSSGTLNITCADWDSNITGYLINIYIGSAIQPASVSGLKLAINSKTALNIKVNGENATLLDISAGDVLQFVCTSNGTQYFDFVNYVPEVEVSTNLIILNATYDPNDSSYSVSYATGSMSYSDAVAALNNNEIVYVKLNESLHYGGTFFSIADYYKLSSSIVALGASFTPDTSVRLSCSMTDSAIQLIELNFATYDELQNAESLAYMPRARVSSGTNLNAILTPGCYKLDSTLSYTNAPAISEDCTLSVIKTTDGSVTPVVEQTIKATDNSVRSYIRFSLDNGSTWSDWREEGGYETYESWSSGSHDANSPKLGLLFCRNGSSYTTNLPSSGSYGYLLTQGRIGANCLQTYVGYSSDGTTGMYIRYYANSQWYPWVLIGPASYTDANNISY